MNLPSFDGGFLLMRRFNTYQLYNLGAHLKELAHLEAGEPIYRAPWAFVLTRLYLEQLLEGQPLPIRITRQAAQALSGELNHILEQNTPPTDDAQWTAFQISRIQSLLSEFNTVLNAELANLDTYWIEPKGIYATNDLIEHAEYIFSGTIRTQLADETRLDINEAGKCLAFDLATAAAFHTWRAAERELRTYYQLWVGQSAGNKGEATLLKELGGTNADNKVIAVLDHLRELHRNPTMNPEDYLTVEEAVSLFGIAHSAITAMITNRPALQSRTGSNEP